MKKGSSKHKKKKKPQQQQQQSSRYPTRDNVYNLQQERQKRQAQQRTQVRQQRSSYRTAQPAPQRTSQKKRKSNHMIMPLIIFAIIAIYLIGQIAMLMSRRSDINVETVAYGSIDTPEIYSGLILRDEYVIKSNRSGQPFYQYTQGDYVTKGAVVCTVKDTGSTDILEDKLEEIDQDILKSQKTRTDLSAFSEDISRLEDNMMRTVDSYAGNAMKSGLSYMYTMKSQVTSFMEQRNEIWLTENVDSFSQLTDEKNVYEKQLAQSMSSLTAKESGVLCLSYDGLEETLNPDKAAEITKKEIGGAKTEYISKAKNLQEGDPVFKIVMSNKWYIVAYLPTTATATWEKGTAKRLNLMTKEETLPIGALIESIEPGEKETKVVFSSYEYMEEFMENRTVSFSLEGEILEGLKIPNDAIVEKSLIRIPRVCVTESMGSNGVLLVQGTESRFVEISASTSDEDAVYISQENSSLKLGDVILQGTGETASNYTISELQPCPGVYVANSSMAKFVVVEIMEQNQEYAIIKTGNITGLQPYDTIVSDAKNISEGQSIY